MTNERFSPKQPKKSLGERAEQFVNILETGLEKGMDAYTWSARKLYELGRMTSHQIGDLELYKGHTTWKPVFYKESGMPREIERESILSVSIPFKMNGKWYPASRDRRVLDNYDPEFPMILLQFQDPHKDMIGDEILNLDVRGKANDVINASGEGIVWRIWMPGSTGTEDNIILSGKGAPIAKDQAELTAADIIEHFTQTIHEKSGGKLVVRNTDLYTGLGMISEKAPSLSKRWELLAERLKLQRNLVEFPYIIAMIALSMIDSDEPGYQQLISDIQTSKIRNWSSILTRIDALPEVITSGPAATLPALLISGMQTRPETNIADKMHKIPPSILLSLPGLMYFNTVIEGYRNVLQPQIAAVANQTVKVQEESLKYLQEYLKIKAGAWTKATEQLKAEKSALYEQIENQVGHQISQLLEELSQQLEGMKIQADQLPAPDTNTPPSKPNQ